MTRETVISVLKSGWIPRSTLADMLEMNDLETRMFVRDLNLSLKDEGLCILSSSTKRGYHIPDPTNEKDVALAMKVVRELKAKAASIYERSSVIDDFIKFSTSAKTASGVVQLDLFEQ